MHAPARRTVRAPAWTGLLLLAAAGCAPGAPSAAEGGGARVEADVFSGRPNPAWELGAAEAGELGRRFRRLAPAPGGAELPEGLGYRGLVVTGAEAETGGCGRVLVREGTVRAECGGTTRTLADPDRALERWLARTAEGRAPAEVARLLREETGA